MAVLLIVIGVIGIFVTGKSFFMSEEAGDEVTLSPDPFDHIVVDGQIGNVHIHPSLSSDIEIRWKGTLLSGNSSEDLVSIEENDSQLKVNIGKRRFFDFSFFNINFSRKLQVDVYLPDKQFNSLVVKNDVGNTNIKDIRVGNLTTKTDVSNLTMENITANSIVAETDVGNLTLNNVHGKLLAKSDVGSITIHNDKITDDMDISSDVGKIRITVPQIPTNVTFNANSSVGSIRVFEEKGSYISKNADYIVSMTTDVGSIKVNAEQ